MVVKTLNLHTSLALQLTRNYKQCSSTHLQQREIWPRGMSPLSFACSWHSISSRFKIWDDTNLCFFSDLQLPTYDMLPDSDLTPGPWYDADSQILLSGIEDGLEDELLQDFRHRHLEPISSNNANYRIPDFVEPPACDYLESIIKYKVQKSRRQYFESMEFIDVEWIDYLFPQIKRLTVTLCLIPRI